MTVLYRSCQFFAVGVVTSAVGHSITKWAVSLNPLLTFTRLFRSKIKKDPKTMFISLLFWITVWDLGHSWRFRAICAIRP